MQNIEDAAYSLSNIKKVVTPQPLFLVPKFPTPKKNPNSQNRNKLYTIHQIKFLQISTHMGPTQKQDGTFQEIISNK